MCSNSGLGAYYHDEHLIQDSQCRFSEVMGPMVYWAPPAFGLKLAQSYNDACSAAHRKYPDRFVGLAMLPMQQSELALEELERAGKLPGMRGVMSSNCRKKFFTTSAR